MSNSGTYESLDDLPEVGSKRVTTICVIATGVVIGLGIILFAVTNQLITIEAITKPQDDTAEDFAFALSIDKTMKHLAALQDIADKNSNSRSVRTGYNASLAYIEEQLRANTDYEVEVQHFSVDFTQEESPPTLELLAPSRKVYEHGVDFRGMNFQASGNVTANIAWVGFSCDDGEYEQFTAGDVAFGEIGGLCGYYEKVEMAEKHNASAFVMMNRGGEAVVNNIARSVNLKTRVSIPALSISYQRGVQWNESLAEGPVTVHLTSNTSFTSASTMNLIADMPGGKADRVVVVGSHLDSVDAGPGINDNGSGSAANLEIALEMYRQKLKPTNKVRFCWFGAEELGKKGSSYYVDSLSKEARANISVMLNMDMVGSPNFFRGVYDGRSVDEDINAACSKVMGLFESWFDDQDLAHEPTEFDSRSDYYAFLLNGIPAGGLFTGAEVKKNDERRSIYGGVSNSPYDACYHAFCDTLENIDQGVLLEMTQACAYVTYTLAFQSNLPKYLHG